jgi:hypothetical protein
MTPFLVAAALAGLLGSAAAAPDTTARSFVVQAIDAMGGEARLRAIHTLRYESIGHRNMLEQSERPEGPRIQDYGQITELLDFSNHRWWVSARSRGYSSAAWWLQSPDFDPPVTLWVAGGYAAFRQGTTTSGAGSPMVQDADDELTYWPFRALLAALDAPDLARAPDVTARGYRHHVVCFTHNGRVVRIVLSGYTSLPTAVEVDDARPTDTFWYVWGDFVTRYEFSMWSLEPTGVRVPREWTWTRNGLPDETRSITALTFDAPAPDSLFAMDSATRAAFTARRRTSLDEVRLPVDKAQALAPDLTFIPGRWNVSLLVQPDGILVLEAPISAGYSRQVLAEAARRYPGRRILGVITTSDSWPHIGGIREYVARGIPIYALDLNVPILTRAARATHRSFPDSLARAPRAPVWRVISGPTTVGSLRIIPYRSETGERQMMVYFPAQHLLYTSDLFAPIDSTHFFTPEYLREAVDAVNANHLVVEQCFGMHYGPMPWATVSAAIPPALGRG